MYHNGRLSQPFKVLFAPNGFDKKLMPSATPVAGLYRGSLRLQSPANIHMEGTQRKIDDHGRASYGVH